MKVFILIVMVKRKLFSWNIGKFEILVCLKCSIFQILVFSAENSSEHCSIMLQYLTVIWF